MKKISLTTLGSLGALISGVSADQVILDDLIVNGSAGIGQDAVNGESFGFDTIRLKENNLRIKFQDTSNSASFPTNDWQLTANDSTNGGKNKFSIDDIDGGRTPFTIEASAPSHSLYVDSGGRVGLGTQSPVVELHIPSGDTPTVRLEQDGTSGFTPQTWDVAGNETNFFVRDATNGSRLPFKIRPSAPTNSLYVDTDGDIGLGTASPSARLDVIGAAEVNGSAVVAANDSATAALTVSNDGSQTLLRAEAGSTSLTFSPDGSLRIVNPGGFGTQTILDLDAAGNLTALGTVNGGSDVNRKENFEEVNTEKILEKVAEMPVKFWSYKGEEVTHIGPMAQDFYKQFQLGQGEKTIAMADADGVALASIQALYKESKEKDQEISDLKKSNRELQERLEKIEALLKNH